jgi:hypothetical protein
VNSFSRRCCESIQRVPVIPITISERVPVIPDPVARQFLGEVSDKGKAYVSATESGIPIAQDGGDISLTLPDAIVGGVCTDA